MRQLEGKTIPISYRDPHLHDSNGCLRIQHHAGGGPIFWHKRLAHYDPGFHSGLSEHLSDLLGVPAGRRTVDIRHIGEKHPQIHTGPFYLAISTVWALIGCLVAKQYVLIFQMFAFPTTNPMVFKIAIDVLAFMLLTKGLYNISKASTVFLEYHLDEFAAAVLCGEFRIERLTPYIFKDGSNMLEGFFQIYLAYLGYELCLLLFPYTDKKTKLFRAVIYGNLIRTISYTLLGFVSFGVVGSDMLKVMLFPLLDLLAYIKLPFIERIENLFYGFFLFTTLITLVLYFWAAGESTQRVFPKIKINVHYFFIILVALLISYIPTVLNRIREWLLFLGYIQIGFAYIMPFILIMLLLWQRRKRQRDAQC